MMTLLLVLAVLGVGMVIYAIFGVFTSGAPKEAQPKKSDKKSSFPDEPSKEQKIQRLQKQVSELEGELTKVRMEYEKEKSKFMLAQEKESTFSEELKRRQEWVAKAEAELAKIKLENLDSGNKFLAKEKELQEEFSKNVELCRQISELKTALGRQAEEVNAKAEQIQIQKHQIEKQLKDIGEYLTTIAEFNRKEKISEWVPKAEFNQLNEEYTRLEKDLEEKEERLKSFAAEIAHLRMEVQQPKSEEVLETPPENAEGEKKV